MGKDTSLSSTAGNCPEACYKLLGGQAVMTKSNARAASGSSAAPEVVQCGDLFKPATTCSSHSPPGRRDQLCPAVLPADVTAGARAVLSSSIKFVDWADLGW